jgi:uncharacterized protein with PIN domain
MSSEKDELEVRLLKQAEKAIHHLLEQKGERRDLSISEMEALVGELEMDLRQTWMQELVDETYRPETSVCEACGGKLRAKGKKSRRIVTLRGEVEVQRDYYYCDRCKRGYFPPG